MKLLASVVASISARTLRDINPEQHFDGDATETEAYNFIYSHFNEHSVIPTPEIIAENTGIVLPTLTPDSEGNQQPPEYYLTRVRQRAMTRAVLEPYNRLQEALQTPQTSIRVMESAIDDLYQIKSTSLQSGTGIELSSSLITTVMEQSRARLMNSSTITGITTGYEPLDIAMDGYNRDDLVVWVGRPGRGKSWLLLKQAHAAWVAGYKPLYVSMEMGGLQNMRRLLGIHSGINPTLIKRGQIDTLAQPVLERAAADLLSRRPLHMVTANFSRNVDSIANFIDQYQPDICYIDAGYLLSPKKARFGAGGRRETISDVIEELKELGVNTGIPIVITVQFNRTAEQRRRGGNADRANGQPVEVNPIAHLSLAEIGETDVIGQTASHVLGIEYPPFPLPNNLYRVFGFLKGREGESGWWATQYMQSQSSPVNLELLPPDDIAYELIRSAGTGARNRPTGQRSAAMSLQD
jgi:hypothetical protein